MACTDIAFLQVGLGAAINLIAGFLVNGARQLIEIELNGNCFLLFIIKPGDSKVMPVIVQIVGQPDAGHGRGVGRVFDPET